MNFLRVLEITTSLTCEKPSNSRVPVRGTIVCLLPPNFDWVFLTVVIFSKSLTRATPRRGS